MMTSPTSNLQDDAMGASIPFCFIEYLCAERGIERGYALDLVGTYLITRSAGTESESLDVDQIVNLHVLEQGE